MRVLIIALLLISVIQDVTRSDKELSSLRGFSQKNGSRLLCYDAAGHIDIVTSDGITDVLSGLPHFRNPKYRAYPTLSRDGKRIAFVQAKVTSDRERTESAEIWVFEAESRSLTKLIDVEYALALSWSPAGTELAVNAGNVGLIVFSLGDYPEKEHVVASDISTDDIPSWSPDGLKIAFESQTGTSDRKVSHLNVVDVSTGKVTVIGEGRWPSWSPRGDRIAYLDSRAQTYFSIPPTGGTRTVLVKAGYSLTNGPILANWLVWSPDGDSAIYNAFYDGGVEAWHVDLASGKKSSVKQNGYVQVIDWRTR